MSEFPKAVVVKEVIDEAKEIKTFIFNDKIDAKPGQFLMVWLPEIDEKPFTLSYIGEKTGITVQRRGFFTSKLHLLGKDSLVGIRGPYGNGFDTSGFKKPLLVAGGCGAASLAPLAELLYKKGLKPTTLIGTHSKESLFFIDRFKDCSDLIITTDDGSYGQRGFTTNYVPQLIKENRADIVFACGPEKMLKKVFDECLKQNIHCQLNLERWMKCAFGLCGHCVINGLSVCKDGPIFNDIQLSDMSEFCQGAYAKNGRKVPIEEYLKR